MEGLQAMRIVLLGKTGAGKSSTANTIFGDEVFPVNISFNSETKKCAAKTKDISGRSITLIDTPGFFDNEMSEFELQPEIVRCLTECAPGPHAFLIVLKLERFTEQENAVIQKIYEYLSEDVLKYAVVVFTHGDQLTEGQQIDELVNQSEDVRDLVRKCGNRYHVIDNKYWNDKPKDEYRSNQLHVEALLNTLSTMMTTNNGGYYTNDLLQAVEEEIKLEEENIRLLQGNNSESEIRNQAKNNVVRKLLIKLAGIVTGTLCGALFGVAVMVGIVLTFLEPSSKPVKLQKAVAETICGVSLQSLGTAAAAKVTGAAGAITIATPALGFVALGAAAGACVGSDVADRAETPVEAVQMTFEAVKENSQAILNKSNNICKKIFETTSK